MLGITLLYVGAVLFVNAMMLLGKVDGKSAAPMNFFTGGITLVMNIYIILKTPLGEPLSYYTAATGLLFSFTYLYVGINNALGLSAKGLGWYCLFVAITAVPTAVLTFQSGDLRFGAIWLMWSFLWFLYFLVLSLEKQIVKLTAYVTLVEAIITCWVPGYLLLIGRW